MLIILEKIMDTINGQQDIGNIFLNIGKLYLNGYLPLINGIITKEKYIKVNINFNGNRNERVSFIENKFDKNISLLEEDCSGIGIFNKLEYNDFILYCGEGTGHGSQGFITIMNKNGRIVWIMFHELINPIINIETMENKIIGINNCNERIEFKINWDELKV
jgi:hypothetical protein